MSGIRGQHLERRCGIFGLRVRVPDDIRPLVGMVEVRRSLRTYDPFRARVLSALKAARLFEVFAVIRQDQGSIDRNDAKAMIADCLREMVVEALGGFLPVMAVRTAAEPPAVHRNRQPAGPTLSEALDAYFEIKEASWTSKTMLSRRRMLGYLREHLGGETELKAIDAVDIRSFRDAICKLRRNTGRAHVSSFAAKQTENAAHRIDGKTATLIFEPTKAFMRWCKGEQGYIPTNPADDIRVSLPKKAKGKKARRPFTADELRKLFTAPLYTGAMSRSRRFDRGSEVLKDGKYWIPILGYYSGARLGELVQLHMADVDVSGSIPHLHITDDAAGASGSSDAKHVKSDAGVRRIPLHPDVIQLGFREFVEKRRRMKRSSKRLFHDVPIGSDEQASTVFSKWFGRFMDRAGLSDPALVFHSFRHTAEDAFRDALTPQYVTDRIIGHSDGTTSSSYGNGVALEVMYEAVKNMRLPYRIVQG